MESIYTALIVFAVAMMLMVGCIIRCQHESYTQRRAMEQQMEQSEKNDEVESETSEELSAELL